MGKKRNFSNHIIVFIKVACALLLLFATLFFLFDNAYDLGNDFRNWNPFPLILLGGLSFVIGYIAFLISRLWDNTVFRADRLDILYKIIFSIVLISICIRSLFIEPYLNVPVHLIILSVVSGIATWVTPRIVDNNSEEF